MKIPVIVLLACSSLNVHAQQDQKKDDYIPMMKHGIGISFQKFDGLNNRIANFPQYKGLRDYAATLQLGFLKERNRWVSDAGLIAGSSMSGDRDKRSSTIRFAGVNASVGYDLIKSEKVMLYPLAGLALEKYQARFFKDNSSVNFDDILQSPATQNSTRPVDFNNAFFAYRLGMGVALLNYKYGSVGLQAVYTGSFKSKSWKINDEQVVANAPVDNLSRIEVGLVFSRRARHMK